MTEDELSVVNFLRTAGTKALTLHQMPVGKDAVYGYENSDARFLSKLWAKQAGAYFFNWPEFFLALHENDTEKIDLYKKQLKEYKDIISDKVLLFYVPSYRPPISDYWRYMFTELKDVWMDPKFPAKKLVMPLTLGFSTGVKTHASVACFNFKPKQNAVDVVFLEQHAQRKGAPDYDASVDYTDELVANIQMFQKVLHDDLGIPKVNVFLNQQPVCRRHNVCGVVASELARRLLLAKDPMVFAKSAPKITHEEVDLLHARNQKLEADSVSSTKPVPTNGGRV